MLSIICDMGCTAEYKSLKYCQITQFVFDNPL